MSANRHGTPEADVEERVRARLRRLRRARGLTLAEVASAAGMDTSTLSRLESGARRLGLAHLPPLARALGVTAEALLAEPLPADPRVRGEPRIMDGMTIWPLTQESGDGMRAYKMLLPADRREPDQRTHEGHEWLYVLSGRLRLVLHDEEFVLAPGEAAEFSTLTPHWSGVVAEPVELITIFGPQGERVHFRG